MVAKSLVVYCLLVWANTDTENLNWQGWRMDRGVWRHGLVCYRAAALFSFLFVVYSYWSRKTRCRWFWSIRSGLWDEVGTDFVDIVHSVPDGWSYRRPVILFCLVSQWMIYCGKWLLVLYLYNEHEWYGLILQPSSSWHINLNLVACRQTCFRYSWYLQWRTIP